MREVQGDLPSYAVVSVRDGQGRLVCSSNPQAASEELDQHCFRTAPASGAWQVQTGLHTPATGRRGAVLPLCVAFSATEGRTGHLVLELSLDWLAAHIGELRLPPHSTVGIADRQARCWCAFRTSAWLHVADILSDIDNTAWLGLVLMALGVALSLALASIAGERFVRRPTAALLDAARCWSEGNLAARARLAAAFNAMAEVLRRRRAEQRS